jgi:hypothetical protein
VDTEEVVDTDAEVDADEDSVDSADVDDTEEIVGFAERVGSSDTVCDGDADSVCCDDSDGAVEGIVVTELLVDPDTEFEGWELIDGIEEVVAELVNIPESEEDGVKDLDAEIVCVPLVEGVPEFIPEFVSEFVPEFVDILVGLLLPESVVEPVNIAELDGDDDAEFVTDTDCVALTEGVPERLSVEVSEPVTEPVTVRVEVVVPELDPETVDVLVVVPEAVPEFVTDAEAVSLDKEDPVPDTVGDTVLVRETEAEAVGVEAAEADIVADVVFVAECVSGLLVSVVVVVCDADSETERLEVGVADHVLEGVAVNVETVEADPDTVEVLDAEMERVPVGEIVEERVVLIVLEVVELTDCVRVPLDETDDDTEFVGFVDGVPEKVGFTVSDPDAEIEDDHVDDLDAVFVGEPEFVLEIVAVEEIERVAEIVRV